MGMRVCGHAEGLDGCAAAIRHGVDTIEHGMYLHRRPDLLEAMAAAGQVLVPTLSGYYEMAGLGDVIDPTQAHAASQMPPMLAELAQHNLAEGAATMLAAMQAGVKIALGSDVSLGTGLELQRMVHHGLTPVEALTAATKTAAEDFRGDQPAAVHVLEVAVRIHVPGLRLLARFVIDAEVPVRVLIPAVGFDELVFLPGRWLVLAPLVQLVAHRPAVLDQILRERVGVLVQLGRHLYPPWPLEGRACHRLATAPELAHHASAMG